MAPKHPKITKRGDRYARDLGWKLGDGGKPIQHRFYFSKEMDLKAVERAVLLLEQLWDQVVDDTRKRNQTLALSQEPVQPLWERQSLWIAKAIVRGENHLEVPYFPSMELAHAYPDAPHGAIGADAYATLLHDLKVRYPFMTFIPGDPNALSQGKRGHADFAEAYARKARRAATVAQAPIPIGIGDTLYQALDSFAKYIDVNRRRAGQPTAWSRTLIACIARLKRCSHDIPVEQIDITVVEAMVRYWTNRPNAENTGRPIAITTVEGQVKALRMFLKWLHKTPAFKWRGYTDVEDALRVTYSNHMTHEEIAGLKSGVETFTPDELATLYRYATDRERVLMLLGLNCAFARAECVSFRKDELHLETQPPTIKRIRRKSMVYSEFALWPQTVAALKWVQRRKASVDSSKSPFVLVTPEGNPMREQGIANAWSGLLNRVRKDHPNFSKLSFKYLRKTAGQLVRNMSDGETAGVFLSHGQPVKSDSLLDIYTNRDFSKVFAALERVQLQLAPVFAAAPGAFTNEHNPAEANISRATIDAIIRLHAGGKSVTEISRELKVSRQTVYRWLPKTSSGG